MKLYASFAMLMFLFVGIAISQTTDAIVSGTVIDPSGAHVVGANVSAVNDATGVAATTQTNDAGIYVFPSLQPGVYRFTAEHPGFRKALVTGIDLAIGSRLTVNLNMEIGSTTDTVEVKAIANEVNTTSASVGDVVSGKKLLDLPLAGRSAYDLLTTQPGVISGTNFYLNGNRGGSVNFTMDGINAQNNLLSGSFYLYSNVVSVDRAEEFRVVTSSADAEYGRGSGQVQMVTRSGSNAFRGSAFYELRNTALNANDFFNNARGTDATGAQVSPRNLLIQNNYGIRFGGPVKKNKTFFNGIYEPYKQRAANAFTATVYTQNARNGIFRFFPGALNGNASSTVPTVDTSGNPIQPAAATGALQSVNIFGRDPNRLIADPTGIMTHQLSLMPLPNNFRVGDGLNTAGFTWNRPVPVDFELYEGRIDHIFNEAHRLTITLNQQSFHSYNVATPQPYPAVPGQVDPTETTQYSAALTSVLRPNLLNDLRVGIFRPRTLVLTPFDINQPGSKGLLPVINGVPFLLNYVTNGVTNPVGGNQSNYIAPVYQIGDNMTWIKGRHSFKGGFEIRFISDSGFDANNVTPTATIGALAVPVAGVSTIPSIGSNATLAQNLLLDLTGSVGSVVQTNNSPGGSNPAFLPGETRFREWHQNEYSWFFKDDFKVTPSFTLNLGIRYELYTAPTEGQGKMLATVGGGAGAFGVSGTSFATGEYRPGSLTGSQTLVENIGAGTAHPDVPIYNTDKNNFAPAVGFAWSLPWFGKGKTTIRAGYGIGYERLPIYLTHNNSGFEPGFSEIDTSVAVSNLSNLTLPVKPVAAPLAPVPIVGTGSHTQTLFSFDNNLRTPYSQNFNFSIQRALTSGMSLTVAYVGSKGSKLVRSIDVNEVNIFENGLLDGFKTVQAGGTSPLIDKIFAGLPGVDAAGGGSNFVRTANATTQAFLANNNAGGFANYINTTNALTGVVGGLLPRVGLPSNFVVANPQFLSSYLVGNYGNSSYHSLQVEINRRFASGFSLQGSYVYSRALGEDEGDSSTLQANYRTLRNESLDKRLLNFNHTDVLKINGIYELPFGRGKLVGRNSNGFIDRIIGGWQMGAIANLYTGQPVSFIAQNTINNYTFSAPTQTTDPVTQFTPMLVGQLPDVGVVRTGKGVNYLGSFTQIADPSVANLPASVRSLSTLRAIASPSGVPILVNPGPGQLGNLGLGSVIGPGGKTVDVNLKKNIRINERFTFQIGATARNLTNTPQFSNPNLNINSVNFGTITTTQSASYRIIVLQGRLNF